MARQTLIELLAPARNGDVARAAIDCGADAIYMGGPSLGARRAAANSVEEIAAVVDYAHRFDVKVYVTLNTLLREEELREAEALARQLIDVGVDAFIVQDMAWLRMGLPVELHASTQTFNASVESVAFLAECGVSRVVLERNLSLADVEQIAREVDVELEAFVHGALCVGYSGRCFLSRSMGPRSGNRGDCMQACRLSYDLEDGGGRRLMRGKHLLSVCDLDLSQRVGQLLDAGISSFKIEGRLKDEAYVRNVVSHYRHLIDRELAKRPALRRSSAGRSVVDFSSDLSKTFSRSGGEYLFDGRRAGVAEFGTPKAMGERLGRISAVRGNRIVVGDLKSRVVAGDGLCYMSREGLVGTNVNGVEGDALLLNRADGVRVGTEIYRNYDHAWLRALSRARLRRAVEVRVSVEASAEGLSARFVEVRGEVVERHIRRELPEAENRDSALKNICEALSKSGTTMFDIVEVCFPSDGFVPFVPTSELSALRREALDELTRRAAARVPERRLFVENLAAVGPREVGDEANVINSVAEQFYRDHGAERVERGRELLDNFEGVTVMTTRYCLRREMGECLREGSSLRGPLFLTHGHHRYELRFDCAQCEMSLLCVGH